MTRERLSSWIEVQAPAQQQSRHPQTIVMRESSPKTSFTVHTSLLFDPHQKKWLKDAAVEVDKKSGLITSVTENMTSSALVVDGDIDIRGYTVVPGFVEAHGHMFLHDYAEASSLYQERDESFVERVVRATQHARLALLAGYTTYRDLGTEGLYAADVSLRDAINRNITPGPRMFVVSEALASSGGYAIRTETAFPPSLLSNNSAAISTIPPRIADSCDGPWECRAAVRRRIGAGADLIKIYGDYRKRALRYPVPTYPRGAEIAHPPEQSSYERSPSLPLFTKEEVEAIVDEAKRARCSVAAHCVTPEMAITASNAGVTSVEHAYLKNDEMIKTFARNGTIYVPTLTIIDAELDTLPNGGQILKEALEQVYAAFKAGVTIASGADIGAVAHGQNVREVELLLMSGIPLEDVLVAVTLTGWKACGGEWAGRRFGAVKEGWAADFVALDGDLREDRSALRKVKHVVKDGEWIVRDGRLTR